MTDFNIAENSANKGEQIVEMLESFGLFWDVKKVNLKIQDPKDSENMLSTDYFGTQRQDNGHTFACVKEGYQVLQNWELAELIQEAAGDFDLEICKGGTFNGGGKVYLQICTGTLTNIGINNDQVKKYITAINSHDASTSLGLGMTNTTISCSNTFHSAYKQMQSKIRHTQSMQEKLTILRNEFSQIRENEQTLYGQFFKMAERPASNDDVKRIVTQVTGIDMNKTMEQAKLDYSTVQINKAGQLTSRIAEEMTIKGQTLWGLFNGVTKYTNYDLSTPKRENATLESLMIGGGSKINNKVFDLVTI